MSGKLQPTVMFVSLLVLTLFSRTTDAATGGLGVYWGRNADEGTIRSACDTGIYDYISIAFLKNFGGGRTPELDLGSHCTSCTWLGYEISYCQQLGIKVLLCLSVNNSGMTSIEDANSVAYYLWTHFLDENTTTDRPLGDVVLDGIDFYVEGSEGGDNKYYDNLVYFLKGFDVNVFLSAAPRCNYPDYYLNDAIATGVFDLIWVQFYNYVSCDLLSSWNTWTSSVKGGNISLGLPASEEAAKSGFIPASNLTEQILPQVKQSENYGGVMLWNRHYDLQSGYGRTIKPYVSKDDDKIILMYSS